MTKSQVKKIASALVAIVLAVAGAYGYVDENCTCGTAPSDELPTAVLPYVSEGGAGTDGAINQDPDEYLRDIFDAAVTM